MQLTNALRNAVAWGRGRRAAGRLNRSTRAFAVGSVILLLGQCGPTDCDPPPDPSARFGWLPVGAALPSDADCAARVRDAAEVRPRNAGPNSTRWRSASATYPRATGNFTGTTDEIIQWAACKWGFDEDVLRAQAAKESWWDQPRSLGDWTTNPANCVPGHPIGADGRPGECPESAGLMQIRTPYFRDAIDGAVASSAYNLDIALSVWRDCFEGRETWLNTVDRGRQYAAGDQWGCIGRWFAGRWYTSDAEQYIAGVRDYHRQRIWETPNFLSYQ